MAVSFVVKVLAGCVGVAGACASASIPFVTGSSSASTPGVVTTQPSGGGAGSSTSMVSLDMCTGSQASKSGNKVVFGTQNSTNMCGSREGSSDSQDIPEKEKINETLKKVWSSTTGGNLGISDVTDYCEQSSSEQTSDSTITLIKDSADSCSGAVYLKIGSGSNTFLKRNKQAQSDQNYQVFLCTGQCWNSNQGDNDTRNQPQTENPSNFKELQFYKRD